MGFLCMRVINIGLIQVFSITHHDAKPALEAWLAETEEAEWKTPIDITSRYASASILKEKRVVFNIKGRRYRLLAIIDFQSGIVVIDRIGTHAEYDKWGLGK
jgi:mRNA interferase HigB